MKKLNVRMDAVNDEARSSDKALVGGVLCAIISFAVIAAGILSVGCQSIAPLVELGMDILDAVQTNAVVSAEEPADDPGGVASESGGSVLDSVAFSGLVWTYGGFDGSRAAASSPSISNLSCNGSKVSYTWSIGLADWGLGYDDAGAIFAVFIEQPDGSWVGGKVDWVSTSRTSRDFKHMLSYNNWPKSGVSLPLATGTRVAVVVVSANGALRSNVAVAIVP